MSAARTIVLARTFADAASWCLDNGVRPHARTTIIATRGLRLRGLTLRPTDQVIDLGGAAPVVYEDLALIEALAGLE